MRLGGRSFVRLAVSDSADTTTSLPMPRTRSDHGAFLAAIEGKIVAGAYAYLQMTAGEPAGDEAVGQQSATIARYALDRRIEIVGEFRDWKVDGENEIRHRDGLYDLMDEAVRNDVRVVVVERPERLANDRLVREVLLAALDDRRLRVLSAENDVDLTAMKSDPVQELARRVFRVYTEGDKVRTTSRLRLARRRVRQERGWCEGAKRFGHYSGEQETLRRLLQLRRKPRGKPRRTYQSITDILNAEGRRTRFGGPWTKATVRRLVLRHVPPRSPAHLRSSERGAG